MRRKKDIITQYLTSPKVVPQKKDEEGYILNAVGRRISGQIMENGQLYYSAVYHSTKEGQQK